MPATATAVSPHRYERLAAHLAPLIERGVLRPGDRLRSVRRLSSQRSVSVATVLHAFLLLEDRGLVEVRPQSGHYVGARRRPLPPEPRAPRATGSSSLVSVGALIARVYGATRDSRIVPFGAATL